MNILTHFPAGFELVDTTSPTGGVPSLLLVDPDSTLSKFFEFDIWTGNYTVSEEEEGRHRYRRSLARQIVCVECETVRDRDLMRRNESEL